MAWFYVNLVEWDYDTSERDALSVVYNRRLVQRCREYLLLVCEKLSEELMLEEFTHLEAGANERFASTLASIKSNLFTSRGHNC
jgi:hypothetical protein